MEVDPKFLLPLEKKCVYFDPTFIEAKKAESYYNELLHGIRWETTAKINRWVCLLEENNQEGEPSTSSYKYRDAPGGGDAANVNTEKQGEEVLGFPDAVQCIRQEAQAWYHQQTGNHVSFNVCLLNYYEDGNQRIGWHSDREEIGRTTPIASVSLGATRQFLLRNKTRGPQDRLSMHVTQGSLTIMENICQLHYLHSIPRQSTITEGRINLTFRCKDFTTEGEKEHERRDDWLAKITAGVQPNGGKPWLRDATQSGVLDEILFGGDVEVGDLDEDFPHIFFLVKTNIGAEQCCGAEIRELLGSHNLSNLWKVVARPSGMDGFVACCCGGASKRTIPQGTVDDTVQLLVSLRSANHVLDFHDEFQIADCCTENQRNPQLVEAEQLYAYFKGRLDSGAAVISSLEKLADTGGGTFRATCDRVGGPHAFQRPQVEFEMGGALQEYYEKRLVRPRMVDYDVCIRIEIIGYRVVVGTQLNVADLSKDRHFLTYRNAVTIKTNIAYILIRLANVRQGNTLLDPFCGSGTLLLEALEVYERKLFCIGLDVSRRAANGARENAAAEKYGQAECRFECTDARGLRKHAADNSVDAIVTNLPWGVQTGQKNSISGLKTLYEVFLRTSWYVLKPGARVVLLVLRGLQIMRIVRKLNGRYRLLSFQVIRTTNNLPSILVIEKLETDSIRDNVKAQLAYMSQYVNVSPEMHRAIHSETVEEED